MSRHVEALPEHEPAPHRAARDASLRLISRTCRRYSGAVADARHHRFGAAAVVPGADRTARTRPLDALAEPRAAAAHRLREHRSILRAEAGPHLAHGQRPRRPAPRTRAVEESTHRADGRAGGELAPGRDAVPEAAAAGSAKGRDCSRPFGL